MFFTRMSCTSSLLKLWHEPKVIAILKPNEDPSVPGNYRMIFLLSIAFEVFKRLLLRRF